MVKYSTVPSIEECLLGLDAALAEGGVEGRFDIEELLTPRLKSLADLYPEELIRIFKDGLFTDSVIVFALRGQVSDAVVGFLRDALLHHERWAIRYAAAVALSGLEDVDSVDVFIEALKDADNLVRFCAAEYLELHGDERALHGLKELLTDVCLQQSSPGLISLATRAIRRIEQEDAE